MAQKLGRELLIKIGNGATPETFTTVCGFDARSLNINNNFVDSTVPSCNIPSGIVEESGVYGVQSMVFSGSGKFDNDSAGVALADAALLQSTSGSNPSINFQVLVPGWKTFTGPFLIESFNLSGSKEGNADFEATFRKGGAVTVSAS